MPHPEKYGCKVDKVSGKYELDQLDERIQRRRDRWDFSLRDLETYINSRVLRAAMIRADMSVLQEQPEDYYRRLAEKDEGSYKREEVKNALMNAGVEIDEVEGDFVSYQTVRKHLNECLGISTSQEYEPDLRESQNRIRALKRRIEQVVTTTVVRLRKHGALTIGKPDVMVNVKIRCSDCGGIYSPRTLFDNNGCECQHPDGQDSQSTHHDS